MVSVSKSLKRYRCGTDRILNPDESFARVEPFLNKMGITRVGNLTGLDVLGVPVWAAYRPNSRSLAVTQGKGQSPAAARTSAVFEAIESWHGERVTGPMRYASSSELKKQALATCQFDALPRAFGRRLGLEDRILWLEGQDIASGKAKLVPFEMVHTDFTLPLPAGSGYFPTTSNGLASGNNYAEAVVHSICELIERDSLALWLRSSSDHKSDSLLNLSTVSDKWCSDTINRFISKGVETFLWDITTDIGVPSFLCTIVDHHPERSLIPNVPTSGTGCHLRREVALSRAVSEAAQSRLTVISGARDDLKESDYTPGPSTQWYRTATERQSSIVGRDFTSIPTWSLDSLLEDVDQLLQHLDSVGLREVIVCDLSLNVPGAAVVRAVVPGLEGSVQSPAYTSGVRAVNWTQHVE